MGRDCLALARGRLLASRTILACRDDIANSSTTTNEVDSISRSTRETTLWSPSDSTPISIRSRFALAGKVLRAASLKESDTLFVLSIPPEPAVERFPNFGIKEARESDMDSSRFESIRASQSRLNINSAQKGMLPALFAAAENVCAVNSTPMPCLTMRQRANDQGEGCSRQTDRPTDR